MTQPVSSIAIFGNAHEVWPVAAILSNSLPKLIRLIVAENTTEEIDSGISLPWGNSFHKAIGITSEDLVLNANGTLGLGVDMRDWQGDGSYFFAAPSGTLPKINGVALHHILLNAALMQGLPDKLAYFYDPFRFSAQTALAGKFTAPSNDSDSPATMLGPTVQFDRIAYTALLKTRFGRDITDLRKGKVIGVTLSSDDGSVRTVQRDIGEKVTADFFIDVSGDLSAFLPDLAGSSVETFSSLWPFDYLISIRKDAAPEHTHTIARAMNGSVLIETPIREGTISELLFSSQFMDIHTAQTLMGQNAKLSNVTPHYMTAPWTGNVARLGTASACFGPYQSADMVLLQEQALHLAQYIPARLDMTIEATEFNRRQQTSAKQLRDFLSLPYILNNRNEPFWDNIRQAQLPKTLQIRLDQFKSRGRFVSFDHEIFDEQLWIDMMIGFGVVPQRCDPIASTMAPAHVVPSLTLLDKRFRETIQGMVSYEDYISAFLKAARKA